MKHWTIAKAYNVYASNAKHTIYALGFTYKGHEYVTSLKHLNKNWLYWDFHRGTWQLRLRLSDTVKRNLVKKAGCVCLGKTEDVYSDCEYNKGDQLERILYEAMTGKTWQKDYTPWYEGADIEISDTIRIQVKRESATLTNMTRLETFA